MVVAAEVVVVSGPPLKFMVPLPPKVRVLPAVVGLMAMLPPVVAIVALFPTPGPLTVRGPAPPSLNVIADAPVAVTVDPAPKFMVGELKRTALPPLICRFAPAFTVSCPVLAKKRVTPLGFANKPLPESPRFPVL